MGSRSAVAVLLVLAVAGCTGPQPRHPIPPATSSSVASLQPQRARAAHTATLLPDGRVLIAGGCAVDGCTTAEIEPSSEFYLPGRGFVPGPPMMHPRSGQSATALRDGRVLIVGGWAHEGTAPLAQAEIFDPDTNTFASAGTLRTGRGGQTASLLPDGRVLIAGGWSSAGQITASVEIFDPRTDSFSAGPPMPGPRDAAAAVTLPDGNVLVTGGRDARHGHGLSSTVIFDPAASAWRDGPTMSTPRFKHAIIAVKGGRALVLGGTTDDTHVLASTEILDPATLTSTPGPTMSASRYKFVDAVARATGGQLVVAGGSGVDVLAANGSRFHALSASQAVRSFATATALRDGGVLVVGGYDDRIRIHRDAFLVNPRS